MLRALTWAVEQPRCPSASAKLVLIVYANFANEHGRSYPSTETVATMTGQNIKTVRAAIYALQADGVELLVDTGKRVGRTGNVKVYKLGMEGLPEVGAFKDEAANDAEQPAQEPRQTSLRQARPNMGAFKAPVSGSKGTHIRVAEPVLEPSTPEDATASSAPVGAKKRDFRSSEDWVAPAIADLPPAARAIAEQWPAGAYQTEAAGHAVYCEASRGRRHPGRTWAARIVQLGAKPIRDAKAGLKFAPIVAPTSVVSAEAHAVSCEGTAAFYERIGRIDDAVDMRRQAAAARGR